MKKLIALTSAAVFLSLHMASAQITLQAILSGLNEVGPNASPATGFGTVVLNAAQTQITVDENWSGLTTPATASHIHTAPIGVNGAVTFPFAGVPAATTGAIPQQVFAITPAQVTLLLNLGMYMNVHTSTFPGGEIRAQLVVVPEPATLALVGLGGLGLALRAWNKRRAQKA